MEKDLRTVPWSKGGKDVRLISAVGFKKQKLGNMTARSPHVRKGGNSRRKKNSQSPEGKGRMLPKNREGRGERGVLPVTCSEWTRDERTTFRGGERDETGWRGSLVAESYIQKPDRGKIEKVRRGYHPMDCTDRPADMLREQPPTLGRKGEESLYLNYAWEEKV